MVEEVLNLLNQINLEWYNAKKEAFEKETLYDHEKGRIHDSFSINDSYVDDEGITLSSERDILIDIEFIDYCWDSDFLYSSEQAQREVEGLETDLPISLINIANGIICKLEGYFKVAGTPNNIAASLSTILEAIKERLIINASNIKIDKPDKSKSSAAKALEIKAEYTEVLNLFYLNLRKLLQAKYKPHLVLSNLELDYDQNSRLVFSVSQDELSALLYVLNTAGFFKSIAPGDTSFINFCKERFYYSKGVNGEPTKAKDLRRKYNDAKSDTRLIGNVIERLKQAFKEV